MAGPKTKKPRAVALDDAWFTFAPQALRAAFNAYKPGDIYGVPANPAGFKPEDKTALTKILSQAPMQLMEQLGMIELPVTAEMKAKLIAALAKNRLVASGLPVRPQPGHVPVRIPASMCRPDFIKWRKGVIEGRGFSYADVTVAKAVVAQGVSLQAAKPVMQPAPASKPVKTQRREAVEDAFRRIEDDKEAKPPRDKKEMAFKIKQIASKERPHLFPDGKYLSYQNIYRILRKNIKF